MKARPYQNLARDGALRVWESGKRKALVVMPTGCGKTIVIALIIQAIAKMFQGRVMFLAHRQELIWQGMDKIKKVTGLACDVEMGAYRAEVDKNLFAPRSHVIASTIQTHIAGGDGGGRMGKFNPQDFSLLVVDEAHHATSPSYRRVIEYYMQNENIVVLGVTATPDRADEQALGQIFDAVAFEYHILEAINDGWLVPIEQQVVHVSSLDLSKVRTTAGDLNGADLAAVMQSEKNLHGIAYSDIEILGDRRGIGFAASVHQAEMLSEIFNRHRPGMCNVVSAKTEEEARRKIISDFAAGRYRFIWNCGVFTEGFDDAGVEVVSIARPTKSRALYAQMGGRGTRPHDSIAHALNDVPNAILRRGMIARSVKPSCLIVDHVGNSGKHKLITTADILGGKYSDEVVASASEFARKSGGPVNMKLLLEDEEKKAKELEAEERRKAAEARRARLVIPASFTVSKVDPFNCLEKKPVVTQKSSTKKVASEKMRNFLREKMGLNPDDYDYEQTNRLVKEQFRRWEQNLCTAGQARTLQKFGVDTSNLKFNDARAMLDYLGSNSWKPPQAGLKSLIKPPATTRPIPPPNPNPF